MIHTTPTHILFTTTLQRLAVQLSGLLAHGAKQIAQFLAQGPTPQRMATFERELGARLREVGRRIVAWVLYPVEPECSEETPPRLWLQGRAYRRRRQHRATIATAVWSSGRSAWITAIWLLRRQPA